MANKLTEAMDKSYNTAVKFEKIMSKNGGTLNYKQFQELTNNSATTDTSGLNKQFQDMENFIRKANDQIHTNLPKGASSDDRATITETKKALRIITKSLADASTVMGKGHYDFSNDTDMQNMMKGTLQSLFRDVSRNARVTGIPTGVSKGATNEERFEIWKTNRSIRRSVSQSSSNMSTAKKPANANIKRMETADKTGSISFAKDRTVRSEYQLNRRDLDYAISGNNRAIIDNSSRMASLNTRKADLSTRTQNPKLDENQRNAYTAEIAQIDKEVEARHKAETGLQEFADKLDKFSEKYDRDYADYTSKTDSGDIKVGTDPNSWKGRFMSRSFALTGATIANTKNTITDLTSKGSNQRTTAYDSFGGSVLANGGDLDRSGLEIQQSKNNSFGNMSADETNQAMSSYIGSTGDTTTRGYNQAVKNAGQLGNFGGLGVSNVNQLMEASGNLGLRGTQDFRELGDTFVGAIQESGLAGKSQQESAGLSQVLGSLSGQNISAQQQKNIASTYAGLGGMSSSWQGQAGATAMQQMQQGVSQGYSDPLMRFSFTSGNSRYQGLNGMAMAYKDMQDPMAHPKQMQNMLNNMVNLSGGNSNVAAMRVSQSTGMTFDQANTAVKAAQNGNFEAWAKKQKSDEKKGKSKESSGKDSYLDSGVATIKRHTATIASNSSKMSNQMDGLRNTFNNTLGGHPITTAIASGAGSMVGQVTGDVLTRGVMNGGLKNIPELAKAGGKGLAGDAGKGIAKIGGLFVGSKLGGKAINLAGRTKGAITGTKTFAKGADLAKKGWNLLKGSGESSGFVARGASKLLGRGTAEAGAKTAGKLGGKAAGGIPFLGTAINAGFAVSDLKDKNYIGALGDAIGMIPGIGIAGTALSIGSSLIPSKYGGGKKDAKGNAKLHRRSLSALSGASVTDKEDNQQKGKQDNWITQNRRVIDGYNKMLDKMKNVAAIMKATLSNSGSGSSGDSDDITEGSESTSGVKQWRSKIKKAAKAMGQNVSDKQVNTILKLIQNESGGDQAIKGIDDGDGTGAAMGLMQYKKSTFANYAVKGHKDITNGYDQLLAFFNNSNWSSDIGVGYNGKDGEWRGQASGPSGTRLHDSIPHASGYLGNTPHNARLSEGGQYEAVIPMGMGEQAQGRSLLRHSANILGMNLGDNSEQSKSKQSNNNTTNISPVYNINVNANGNEDTANKIADQVRSSLDNINDIMRRKTDFYSNDIVM